MNRSTAKAPPAQPRPIAHRNSSITEFFKPSSSSSLSSAASTPSARPAARTASSSASMGSSASRVAASSSTARSSGAAAGSPSTARLETTSTPAEARKTLSPSSSTDSAFSGSSKESDLVRDSLIARQASPRKESKPVVPVPRALASNSHDPDSNAVLQRANTMSATRERRCASSSSVPPSSPLVSKRVPSIDLTNQSSSDVTTPKNRKQTRESAPRGLSATLPSQQTIVLSSSSDQPAEPQITPRKRVRTPTTTSMPPSERGKSERKERASFTRTPSGSPRSSLPLSASVGEGERGSELSEESSSLRVPKSSVQVVVEIPAVAPDSSDDDEDGDEAVKQPPQRRRSTRRMPASTIAPLTSDSDDDDDYASEGHKAQSEGGSGSNGGGSEDEDGLDSVLAAALARAKERRQTGQTLADPTSSTAQPSSDATAATEGSRRRSSRVVPPPAAAAHKPTSSTSSATRKKQQSKSGTGGHGKYSLASLVKNRTTKQAAWSADYERGRALLAQERDDMDPSSTWSDEEDGEQLPDLAGLTAADMKNMTDAAGKAMVEEGMGEDEGSLASSPTKRNKIATVQGEVANVLAKTLAAARTDGQDAVDEHQTCWRPVRTPQAPQLIPYDDCEGSYYGSDPLLEALQRDLADEEHRGSLIGLLRPHRVPAERFGPTRTVRNALVRFACHAATSERDSKRTMQAMRLLPTAPDQKVSMMLLGISVMQEFGLHYPVHPEQETPRSTIASSSNGPMVTTDMQSTVARRVMLMITFLVTSQSPLRSILRMLVPLCLQLAIAPHGQQNRDLVDRALRVLLTHLPDQEDVEAADECFKLFKKVSPRLQVELVRAVPSATRRMRDLQRRLAWVFLTREPGSLSTKQIAPSLAGDMIPYLVAVSERQRTSDLITTVDSSIDRDLYARTCLLTIALSDVEDELHALARTAGQRDAYRKLDNALKLIDSNIRQDIRSSDPLRSRAKTNLTKLATSVRYQGQVASGMGVRSLALDDYAAYPETASSSSTTALPPSLQHQQLHGQNDVAAASSTPTRPSEKSDRDAGTPTSMASASGANRDDGREDDEDDDDMGNPLIATDDDPGSQTTLLENKFVKIPSPKKKARLLQSSHAA